jgi:hypothetical protein
VAGLNDVRAKYLASAHAGRPAIPRNLIPAPEQHESAYLLPENAVDGELFWGFEV